MATDAQASGAVVGRAALVLLVLGTTPLLAQPTTIGAPVPTWQPNGIVKALVIDGDTLYAGGAFDHVGPRTGTFAVVDAVDASAVTAGAVMDVVSDIVVADGSGGWFVATGRGPYVGANESGTVLHVLANGTRDPAWTPPTMGFGAAYAMVADAGRLFVGGTFSSVNAEIRLGLAALDTATGAVLPWNANVAGGGFDVFGLTVAANRLYIAGNFSSVASLPRNRVAVLDATTAALLPGTLPSTLVDPTIRSIAASATRVYLEGTCQAGGTFICGYDLDLNPLPGWTSPRSVGNIAAGAAGLFATVPSQNLLAKRVARLDPDTGTELTWATVDLAGGQPLFTDAEPAMHLQGNVLYLGGDFRSVGGVSRLRVAAVDAATGALQPWAPLASGRVRSIATTPTAVALAGDFASIGGVARRNLVALDLRTGRPRNNTPPIDMTWVNALVTLGDVMVAAGWRGFSSQAPDVVAFSTATGTPFPWSMASDNQVYALATNGRHLFVGGWFSSLAGQPRRNLASVDLRTGVLTSWDPSPDGQVSTLTVSGDTLFAAGQFESLRGYGRRGVAAFNATSGEVLSFNPQMPAPGVVKGFGFHADRVLLAGEPDGEQPRRVQMGRARLRGHRCHRHANHPRLDRRRHGAGRQHDLRRVRHERAVRTGVHRRCVRPALGVEQHTWHGRRRDCRQCQLHRPRWDRGEQYLHRPVRGSTGRLRSAALRRAARAHSVADRCHRDAWLAGGSATRGCDVSGGGRHVTRRHQRGSVRRRCRHARVRHPAAGHLLHPRAGCG